jgi:hypothetical protein
MRLPRLAVGLIIIIATSPGAFELDPVLGLKQNQEFRRIEKISFLKNTGKSAT